MDYSMTLGKHSCADMKNSQVPDPISVAETGKPCSLMSESNFIMCAKATDYCRLDLTTVNASDLYGARGVCRAKPSRSSMLGTTFNLPTSYHNVDDYLLQYLYIDKDDAVDDIDDDDTMEAVSDMLYFSVMSAQTLNPIGMLNPSVWLG